jgi:hypothetical protein
MGILEAQQCPVLGCPARLQTELSPFKSFLDLQSMLLAGYPLANKPFVDGHPAYFEELRNVFHRNLFGNAESTQHNAGAIRACF